MKNTIDIIFKIFLMIFGFALLVMVYNYSLNGRYVHYPNDVTLLLDSRTGKMYKVKYKESILIIDYVNGVAYNKDLIVDDKTTPKK